MPDYDRSTGSAGTLRIRDTGSSVEFYIGCSDPATNSGSIPWSASVNGASVGGAVSFPAGSGWRLVAAYPVTTAQTVTFSIGSSGTMGIGGPTSHSAAISRGGGGGGGGGASVPTAPRDPVISDVTSTSFRVTWTAPSSNGGAAIDQYLVRRHPTDASLPSSGRVDTTYSGSTLTAVISGLTPGWTRFYVGVYAHNSAGFSPRSVVVEARGLAGVYVGKGGVFPATEARVGRAGSFIVPEVRVGKDGAFIPAG